MQEVYRWVLSRAEPGDTNAQRTVAQELIRNRGRDHCGMRDPREWGEVEVWLRLSAEQRYGPIRVELVLLLDPASRPRILGVEGPRIVQRGPYQQIERGPQNYARLRAFVQSCEPNVTKNDPEGPFYPAEISEISGTGEGIRTLDPNLGEVVLLFFAALTKFPSAISPAPGRFAQAEFGDEVLRGARRAAEFFGVHAGAGDRMGENEVDEAGKMRGRAASGELALQQLTRQQPTITVVHAGFRGAATASHQAISRPV